MILYMILYVERRLYDIIDIQSRDFTPLNERICCSHNIPRPYRISSRNNTKLSRTMSSNFPLPSSLPVPEDDGACSHLQGTKFPSITLQATSGAKFDISMSPGLSLLFTYPRTGAPGENIPPEWDSIPGARGCSPQACSFRDLSKTLFSLGVSQIFGLSTQDTTYQREVKQRLHLPYDLLSDENLEFTKALNFPTFEWEGKKLVKRSVIAIKDGMIVKVWYPVFPPDASAKLVEEWLNAEGKQA